MAKCTCKTTLFVVIAILIAGRSLSLDTPDHPVQIIVTEPLILSRGGQVELQHSFIADPVVRNFNDCTIRYVYKPQLSCGEVVPSVFPCVYQGVITYQHYGCLLDKELVTFQLSWLTPLNTTQAANSQQVVDIHIFSIELIVKSVESLSNIHSVRFDDDEIPINASVPITYRLIFPRNLIGKCHYEIMNQFPHIRLPMYGKLLQVTNTALPCGFVHSRLHYVPGDYGDAAYTLNDFIHLRIYLYTDSSKVAIYYTVVPLDRHLSNRVGKVEVSRIPETLTIQQAANTPVTPDNLNDGIDPIKYMVEVHQQIGSFRTPQSTELKASYTEFTKEDLTSGCVSFYPHYDSARHSPVKFRYSAVFDAIGGLIVEKEIIVTSETVVFMNRAVQRTNNPLKVVKRGMVTLDSRAIEFYLLGDCILLATMQLAVPPQHGYLVHPNGSKLSISDPFSVQAVSNGTALTYKHSGDAAGFDQMVWDVSCLSAPVLRISVTVLVAQMNIIPPLCVRSTQMFVYHGWSQPLSASNFQIVDPHSIVGDSVIEVSRAKGKVVKATHSLQFNTFSWLFPLVRLNPSVYAEVVSFSLSEVQQQLIWYIPPSETFYDAIQYKLTDLNGNHENSLTNITILQQYINDTIIISTTADYPSVHAKALNMTIISTQPVYITPHYLYSALPPFSDTRIVYLLSSHLENGTLCVLADATCLPSVQNFTQANINQHKLFFSPSTNFVRQIVTMEITVDGFKSHFPKMLTLVINKEDAVVVDTKTFWVRVGRERRIRPFHFPFLSKNTRLRITQGTEYGILSFRNGSSSNLIEFTRNDLAERRVWYKRNSATSSCRDSFKFDIIFKNQTKSLNFLILFRQSKKKLAITISNKPYHVAQQNRFVVRKESFQVQSSFCPEFVIFNVVAPPQFGVLSLIDLQHSLVVQLHANDKFTLKDVNAGLVHYTLLNTPLLYTNISDFFLVNATDPVSSWPMERRTSPQVGRFELLIDTMSEVIENLDLKIRTPRSVTWLPQYNKYGAVLSQSDIDITNSSVEANEVNIQVDFDLNFYYQIEKDADSVSGFTLEDIYSGRVIFAKIMFQENDFEDTITFAVNVEIDIRNETFTALGGTHSLTFVWALVQLEIKPSIVSEESELVNFRIIRTGSDLWFESRVLFSTHSGSAIGANCSESDGLGFDFCHVHQLIVFKPNVTMYDVTVRLLNDMIAEEDESFNVKLSNPENAVFGHESSHFSTTHISIEDNFDYAAVKFEAEIARRRLPCDLELGNVQENENVLAINLTRSRNIHDNVGVLCRTEPVSALEGLDYEGRNSIVWFEANQTSATCNVTIINDQLHEVSEFFRVILEGVENGKAQPEAGHSELCVFIRADINDEPAVSFEETQMVVQESSTNPIFGHFRFRRTGTDLRNNTVLQYTVVDGGNATYGVDYVIYTGGNSYNPYCKQSGQRVGCVVFGEDGAPLQTVDFKVLNDSVYEGNETFHVNIIPFPHMAHVGYPNRLTVTILDSSEPPVVGFEFPNHFENESSHWSNVSVVRSGNLQDTLLLTCSYKGITATIRNNYVYHGDINVASGPEEIIFERGQKRSVCPFRVNDDTEFEGEERFEVYLKTSDSRIIIPANMSSTIVHIHDPEDVPTVQFETVSASTVEPLSNYFIDSESVNLTLVRTGDSNPIVAIEYYLIEGQVDGGDLTNETVDGIETFLGGVIEKQISIPLKANRSSSDDTVLTVLLSEIAGPTIAKVGKSRSLTIQIKNRKVVEPLLPGIPVIVNRGSTSRKGISHKSPLHCVMPCSPNYTGVEIGNTQYKADCKNIDMARSIFVWEYSLDKHDFHAFTTNTSLTNVNSEFLNPIYLQPGMFVRCSCVPVGKDHSRGHPRASDLVRLNASSCVGNVPRKEQRVEMRMNSYSSFAAKNEDLVEISISLPHVDNSLPLILTENLREVDIDAILLETSYATKQVCSSIGNFETSLSTNGGMSWYSSLDYDSCTWMFNTWLPMEHLLQCKANVTFYNFQMAIDIHVVYFYVDVNQTIQQTAVHSLKSELMFSPASLCLPAPIYYHPKTHNMNMEESYVYPIAVNHLTNEIYFNSVADYGSTLFGSFFQNLTLLHNSTQRKRAWKLWSNESVSTLGVMFHEYGSANCTTVSAPHKLTLKFHENTCFPVLRYNLIVHLKGNSSSSESVFEIGDVLALSMKLTDDQRLRLGYSIVPTSISFLMTGNLTSKLEIWKMDRNGRATSIPSARLQFSSTQNVDEIQFEMATGFIQLELSPSNSILTIEWALIDKNGTYRMMQRTNVMLTFSSQFDTTTATSKDSELNKSLTAAIIIFVITFIVATITIAIVVIAIWMWKVRAGWRKKVQDALAATSQRKQSSDAKRMCGTTTGRTEVRSSMVKRDVSSLRRTHSTTGFPATAEHYIREKHSYNYSRPNQAVTSSIPKSRSMPGLLESQSSTLPLEEFLLEPRRNLNKVHTRVKMLNSHPTKIQSSSSADQKRLLKAYKVDNLGTTSRHEMAPKQNNCIVIEDKLNTEKRNEFASFAVRSIAASAKTPEPGSSPRTAL